ncbi:MAG TPA: YkvA family protein [Armatimonadota bacterium]|nr:YkvA family protein [Armatimonadota bacterium]
MHTEDQPFSLRAARERVRDLGARAMTPAGRREIIGKLEEAIHRSKIGGALLDKLRLMADYFRDPAEPLQPKLLVGGALLYLILPGDLVPDWIPLVGFLDDVTVISFVWTRLQDIFLHYAKRREARRLAEEG